MPSAGEGTSRGILLVWIGAVVLFCLHQDLWFWSDRRLIFGFLPVGLAYHAGFSMAAAALWAFAVRSAWPHHLEAWASGDETSETAESPEEGGR